MIPLDPNKEYLWKWKYSFETEWSNYIYFEHGPFDDHSYLQNATPTELIERHGQDKTALFMGNNLIIINKDGSSASIHARS